MRKHAITKVKISEEMTRVAKCPFKASPKHNSTGQFYGYVGHHI